MAREPQTLGDMVAEDEAKALAETRAQMAAERAAWDALSPDERAAINAAREAKFAAFADACDEQDDDETDEQDDEGND